MTTPPTKGQPQIRHFRLWLAVLLVLHCSVVWVFRYTAITFGDDDAGYLILARSLSEFQYRELQLIDAPIAAKYPPGYPAVLAIWQALVGNGLPLLILLNVGLSAATLGVLATVVRRLWSDRLALALTLVLSLSTGIGHLAGRITSEPLFGFLMILSLWALQDQPGRRDRFLVASLTSVAAALVRTAGVAMLAGVLGYWLWRRQWAKAAMFAVLSTATAGAWVIWTTKAPDAESHRVYVDDFVRTLKRQAARAGPPGEASIARVGATVGARVLHNTSSYLTTNIPAMLAVPTIPGTVVDNIAWLAIVALSLVVGVAAIGRAWPACAIVLAANGALLAVWPWVLGRLLAPIVPLLMLSMFLMALRLTRGRFSETPVVLALASVLVVGQIMGIGREYQKNYGCDPSEKVMGRCVVPAERAMLRMTAWLRDSLPSGTQLMSTKERPVYLFSGHKLVNYQTALSIEPRDKFLSYLRSNHVGYVVLSPLGYRSFDLWRRLRDSCDSLAVARFEQPDAIAFQLSQPAEASDGLACRALDNWAGPKQESP